jgi:hypothetical protein
MPACRRTARRRMSWMVNWSNAPGTGGDSTSIPVSGRENPEIRVACVEVRVQGTNVQVKTSRLHCRRERRRTSPARSTRGRPALRAFRHQPVGRQRGRVDALRRQIHVPDESPVRTTGLSPARACRSGPHSADSSCLITFHSPKRKPQLARLPEYAPAH